MKTLTLALSLLLAAPASLAAPGAGETEDAGTLATEELEVWKAPAGVVQGGRLGVSQLVSLPEEVSNVRWMTRVLPRLGGTLPGTHPNNLVAWVPYEGRSLPAEWGKAEEPVDGAVIVERGMAEKLLPKGVLATAKDQGTRLRIPVHATYKTAPVIFEGVAVDTVWHVVGKGFFVSLVGVPPKPLE